MAMSNTMNAAELIGSEAGPPAASAWRQVGLFYLLVTVLSLAVWIPAGAQLAGVLPGHIPALILIASQYSPTVGALLMIGREGGFSAVWRFLKRSYNPIFDLRWYAVPFLIPALMTLGLIIMHALQGGHVPPLLSLQQVQDHIFHNWVSIKDASGGASNDFGRMIQRWCAAGIVSPLLMYCIVSFANGGLSEEAGWRGYALARLLPGRRLIVSGLIVGFFWGLWHTGPAFWASVFGGNPHGFIVPIEYTLGTTPMTVIMAWMFVNAKQSLWPGMLFHACYNGTFFFVTQIWTPERPVASIPEWLPATYVALAIVLVIGRKTMFARGGSEADVQVA